MGRAKRAVGLAVLAGLALLGMLPGAASQVQPEPAIAVDQVYLCKEGGVPCQLQVQDGTIEGLLPSGSTLYFVVENAARQSDLADLRPFVRWVEGEALSGTPTLEYRKLYDATGTQEQGFCYVVGLPIYAAADDNIHLLSGWVSLGQRAGDGEGYLFQAQVSDVQGLEERETRIFNWFSPVMTFSGGQGVVDLFFGSSARYTVNAAGQGAIDLTFNSGEDDVFLAFYPEFEGVFARWLTCPLFNREGTLYLYSDFEGVLYAYDGSQLTQPEATYSQQEQAWVLQTRQLGYYCIAREPLGDPVEGARPDRKANPPVGAGQP